LFQLSRDWVCGAACGFTNTSERKEETARCPGGKKNCVSDIPQARMCSVENLQSGLRWKNPEYGYSFMEDHV